jgi:hypothetical protein
VGLVQTQRDTVGVQECPQVGQSIVDGAVCQPLSLLKHDEVRQILLGEFVHELSATAFAKLARSQRVRQEGAVLFCSGTVAEVDFDGSINTDTLRRCLRSSGGFGQQGGFLDGSCRQRSGRQRSSPTNESIRLDRPDRFGI